MVFLIPLYVCFELILSPNSCLIDIIPGLEQVKEQRREFYEERCHFGISDAEQPVRPIRRLFPKRRSVWLFPITKKTSKIS